MSILLFVTAVFCGYVAGRVSVKHAPPPVTDKESKLQAQLTVAENLNESLKKDLADAKEELWKIKQGKK